MHAQYVCRDQSQTGWRGQVLRPVPSAEQASSQPSLLLNVRHAYPDQSPTHSHEEARRLAQNAERVSTRSSLSHLVNTAARVRFHRVGLLTVLHAVDRAVGSSQTRLTLLSLARIHNGWQAQTRAHASIALLADSPAATEAFVSRANQVLQARMASDA